MQYLRHTSLSNNNLIYWKSTKNFADGCSSHILGGRFGGGNMALPDQGAFILESVRFEGETTLEANHHCNVGTTGVLCMPTYVLDDVAWSSTAAVWWVTHTPNPYPALPSRVVGHRYPQPIPRPPQPCGGSPIPPTHTPPSAAVWWVTVALFAMPPPPLLASFATLLTLCS